MCYVIDMSQRKGIQLSANNFTIEDDDSLHVRFAKIVCDGLVSVGVPPWVYIAKSFVADQGSLFKEKGGGPTLCTPVPKFNHIHWVQAKAVNVGFQYEGPHIKLPSVIKVKWEVLRAELLKATGIEYRETTKNSRWPRMQFLYQPKSLLLTDPIDRRMLIDNTKIALEVAGNVLNWN